MNIVRDRAETYWLPGRFRYALFRLLAYVIYRFSAKRDRRGVVFGIDRDQSVIEQYTISIWLTTAMTVFAYGFLTKVFLRPVAAMLAPLATSVVLHAVVCWPAAAPRAVRWRNHIDLNSSLALLAVIAAAVYFAADQTWIGAVAWIVLGTLALNCVAAVAAVALRSRLSACTDEVTS